MMVLVTGCAGFIGYHLIKTLLDRNMCVVGVDNLNDYYDVNLKKERLKLLEHDNFVFHETDIENFKDMEHVFKSYDFCNIVHLAARAGVRNSLENPFEYVNTNIIGTLNILELMKSYNKKQMTMGSTSSLYANQYIPFEENNTMIPISPYAATKGAAELMLHAYSYLYDLNITVLRFFTVYGELGRPDMSYSKFIKAINEDKEIIVNGSGLQERDFTYVDDIVIGIIKSFIKEGYNLINLGTGETISINELISKLETLLNKKAVIRYNKSHKSDMIITKANNSKALLELNWSPKYSIDEGLQKIIRDIK